MQATYGEMVERKRVLFITTKHINYIRNSQEIRLLEEKASCVFKIYSNRKNYIGRVLEIWGKILFCHASQFDVIFIGFAPQLIAPLMRRFKNQKVIIDFFISVYDTLVNDRKKISANGLLAKLCHMLDCYVIRKANKIIVDTKADKSYFVEEFQGDQDKFEVLYLEADRSIYYPRCQKKRKELKDKFVVLYFGSILPLQGVPVVLESVALLKNRKDIWFQIIGPVPDRYHKPIQENTEYISWLQQEQLAEYIANADLCLAGHFNCEIEKAKRTIPGKAYIYSAMRRPMILGDTTANHELFSESEDIKFVSLGNAEEIVRAIVEFADNTINWRDKE